MHCAYCYLNANKNEWSEEQAQRILDSNIFKRVSKSISISGGEPTLWEPLLDFIDAVREQNKTIPIYLTTNAKKLSDDMDYYKAFAECCERNSVVVNVSWHEDNSVLVPFYMLMKARLLGNIYVTPTYNLKDDETMFNHFAKHHKNTLWTPYILNERYKNLSKKVNAFLRQQTKAVNKRRVVDGEMFNNYELIQRAIEKKNFYYANYDCRCGKNGVIYTNARFYHCLTQALQMHKPLSLSNEREVKWMKCHWPTCYGYSFELKTSKKQAQNHK